MGFYIRIGIGVSKGLYRMDEMHNGKNTECIQVLVVDDSAVVRESFKKIFSDDTGIAVMGVAHDPYIAVKKIKECKPDVIILDVEMPRMDGLTFLKKIMQQHPIPVIICSTLTEQGSSNAVKALEYGAVEVLCKPKVGIQKYIEEEKIKFCDAVKAASIAKLKLLSKLHSLRPKYSADVIIKRKNDLRSEQAQHPINDTGKAILGEITEKIIAIGASTGGTEALKLLLQGFSPDMPGIVVVQHMPEHFTRSFAERLDSLCEIKVGEAKDGERVLSGHAYIAPGNKHTLLKRNGAQYVLNVIDAPLVNRHRPSVDVLFRSVADHAGVNAIGVIMTGMGGDGASGLLEMKEAGALTLAQDEKSCVVYGMPKVAVEKGAVNESIELESISERVNSWYKSCQG